VKYGVRRGKIDAARELDALAPVGVFVVKQRA
jgi:hypothetical protein